jgi:hypothetical protein
MKKKLLVLSSVFLGLLILGYITVYFLVDADVRKNILIAREKYSGKAEDVLIAYLQDPANSPQDRTRVAVWTLGQLRSEKALPVLASYYKNDPEGRTCYGRHDFVLCQYELYKALNPGRRNWWPSHSRLNR